MRTRPIALVLFQLSDRLCQDGRSKGGAAAKALVIEDDPQVARIVSLELRHAGWNVDVATTGQKGLAEALVSGADAVVLDLTLPDLDGLAVCRAIRQASRVPVLILTARGELDDRVEGLDAGADDYLVKPFAPAELIARLRAILRRSGEREQPRAHILQASDLTLDPARREVRRQGRLIELTRREFDLLAYFMENPGIVLTRDMILEKVWGWRFSGGTNVVDVYVGYLRSKVDAPDLPSLIYTMRGVGYVLRSPPAE